MILAWNKTIVKKKKRKLAKGLNDENNAWYSVGQGIVLIL